MKIENTVGNFHLGVIDASGGSCSYGFFSDYRSFSRINFDVNNQLQYCLGDTIRLDYRYQGVTNIRMSGPNDFFVQDSVFVIPITTIQQAGRYIISGDDYIGCDSILSDTVLIRIYEPETTVLTDTICIGEPFSMYGFDIPADSTWDTGLFEYVQYLSTQYTCDSTVILHLLVAAPDTTWIEDATCQDMGYSRYGFNYSPMQTHQTGIFHDSLHLTSCMNCDSVVYLTLTIQPAYSFDFEAAVCAGDLYEGDGFFVQTAVNDATQDRIIRRDLLTAAGCDSIRTLILHIHGAPEPDFISTPEAVLMSENQEFIFTNTTNVSLFDNTEDILWSWDFDDGNGASTFNATHLYNESGDYNVTLSYETSELGCAGRKSHLIHVEDDIEIPNIITPNGDGSNDVFAIVNLNPERPSRLSIYNRWGKKVYECENYQTYAKESVIYNPELGFNAENLSDGVYYYTFYYEGYVRTVEYHGTITVIR